MERSEISFTTNEFARLLCGYEDHKRAKLTHADLDKIARKYRSKPASLLSDLQKKYANTLAVPSRVSLCEVVRILALYPIPDTYRDLIPHTHTHGSPPRECEYDPKRDPRQPAFDPCYTLTQPHMFTRYGDATPLDNIGMATRLLANPVSLPIHKPKPKHKLAQESEHKGTEGAGANIPDVVLRIADKLKNSPHALLWQYMMDRVKVSVQIRRINSIRGTCDGYLKAFDKHMNLLMSDVDETYTVQTTSSRKSSHCQNLRNDDRTRHRHMRQLIIRGDNIVLVTTYPGTQHCAK